MTRIEALEKVAEAARTYVAKRGMSPTWPDLIAAVASLDALPADPAPAEVVEVGAVEYRDGEIRFARVGSEWWSGLIERQWRSLGTTRLPLVKETGQ